jgi:hypothetical protein
MLRTLTLLVCLPLVLVAWPTPAPAQDSVLYEIVENLDLPLLESTGVRVSYWTAQGWARAGSPFCPEAALARVRSKAKSCSVTAFGTDSIDPATLGGTVWANIASVVNCDNPVDAAECVVLTGQMEGRLSLIPFDGVPVVPDLGKRWQILGPTVPLIYVAGTFAPDDVVTLRQSPPDSPPPPGPFKLRATFRLPFQISKIGRPVPAGPGRAFYLDDDGSLIRLHRDESALGVPVLRAEVTFDPPRRAGKHR